MDHTLCGNSPGQNTGVDSLSLLQGIFPTQGSNRGLLHCRGILYQLSHKESPRILKWVAYPFSSRSSQPNYQSWRTCLMFSTFWLGCLAFLFLSCMSCLYILEIKPLSVTLFANIFSHSAGCHFALFLVSFTVQKLLWLIRPHLFIFVLFPLLQETKSKNILLCFVSRKVLRVFSS